MSEQHKGRVKVSVTFVAETSWQPEQDLSKLLDREYDKVINEVNLQDYVVARCASEVIEEPEPQSSMEGDGYE